MIDIRTEGDESGAIPTKYKNYFNILIKPSLAALTAA
jgi:hypothetical protein